MYRNRCWKAVVYPKMSNDAQLRNVVLNLEVILLDLHTRILKIEDSIFGGLEDSKIALQELDYLAQSTFALSEFATVIASEIDEKQRIPLETALEKVPLASLSELLRRTKNDASIPLKGSQIEQTGIVDMF